MENQKSKSFTPRKSINPNAPLTTRGLNYWRVIGLGLIIASATFTGSIISILWGMAR
jgi:hypothetical protein